jgi:hypothetical protein
MQRQGLLAGYLRPDLHIVVTMNDSEAFQQRGLIQLTRTRNNGQPSPPPVGTDTSCRPGLRTVLRMRRNGRGRRRVRCGRVRRWLTRLRRQRAGLRLARSWGWLGRAQRRRARLRRSRYGARAGLRGGRHGRRGQRIRRQRIRRQWCWLRWVWPGRFGHGRPLPGPFTGKHPKR